MERKLQVLVGEGEEMPKVSAMKKFMQRVLETRVYEVEYVVEAQTIEDAKAKIASGKVTAQREIKLEAITERDPWGEVKEIPARS